MKRVLCYLILLFVSGASALQGQQQPPFIFTVYGGLYFPSYMHFREVYKSGSDLIWGVGAMLPVRGTIYLIGDAAFFRSQGFIDPTIDSMSVLQERFFHVGGLMKQPLSKTDFVRVSLGVNYVFVTQTTSSSQSPDNIIELDKKLGYFGGVGVEHYIGEAQISLFGDLVYDYSRSHQKELEGDFGGLRLVVGVHLFLQ